VSTIGNLNFGCQLNDTTKINTIELAESDRPEESPSKEDDEAVE